jgi:hypothetical protein
MRIALMVAMILSMAGMIRAEPLVSGVAVGKRPGPYSFLVATGKERGQLTCFICSQEDKPTTVVFARTLSEPLGQLMVKLDAEMANRKDFKAWMTLLAPKADLDTLAKWSLKQGLKQTPAGAYEDADGPPAYKIHKDADVTVLVFEKKKVLANHVFKAGELNADKIEAMLSDLQKSLKK